MSAYPPFTCDVPGCGQYASIGEGWSGKADRRGRWWCGPHYRELQALRAADEAARSAAGSRSAPADNQRRLEGL